MLLLQVDSLYVYHNMKSSTTTTEMASNPDTYFEYYYSNSSENHTVYSSESAMQIIIDVYVLPVLIILGILVNGSTCYCVRTKQLRKYSVCTYICAYTVSNMLSLILNSSIDWWYSIFEKRHFIHFSEPVCRIWQFFIRLVTYSGVWFVVAMVTDRFILVCSPTKAKSFCSVFVSKATTVAIMIGMIVISVHALWAYSVTDDWCYLHGINEDTNIAVWSLVSGFCYVFIPLIVIFVVGCAALCYTGSTATILSPEQRTSRELTRSTIVISFLYFTFNTPATVINIIDNVAPMTWREAPHVENTMEVLRHMALLLVLINYSSVFFICLTACNIFREVLKKRIFDIRLSKTQLTGIANV